MLRTTFRSYFAYILILCETQLFLIFCKCSSLDQDVVCDMKWSDGGVLDNVASWRAINDKCLETNMFDDRAFMEKFSVNTTLEEFIDLDDNCFVQCCYKADNMLSSDGTINKNETMRMFKGNLTEPVLTKAISFWNDCIADSDKIAKAKGANNCKMLFLHDFCFTKRTLEAGLYKVECLQKPTTPTTSTT